MHHETHATTSAVMPSRTMQPCPNGPSPLLIAQQRTEHHHLIIETQARLEEYQHSHSPPQPYSSPGNSDPPSPSSLPAEAGRQAAAHRRCYTQEVEEEDSPPCRSSGRSLVAEDTVRSNELVVEDSRIFGPSSGGTRGVVGLCGCDFGRGSSRRRRIGGAPRRGWRRWSSGRPCRSVRTTSVSAVFSVMLRV